MLDKTIPYLNIIMRYDGPLLLAPPQIPLEEYHFSNYRLGDEVRWAEMEVDNNDFDTFKNAVSYFRNKYYSNLKKLKERFIGIRNSADRLCACVICWDDIREGKKVSSVHWLLTTPEEQRKGLGTALAKMLVYKFSKLELLPIYLHSQPWSYTAIGIYSEIGFKLLKTDTFKNYKNQSLEALEILEKLMSRKKFIKLKNEMI